MASVRPKLASSAAVVACASVQGACDRSGFFIELPETSTCGSNPMNIRTFGRDSMGQQGIPFFRYHPAAHPSGPSPRALRRATQSTTTTERPGVASVR
jgi:hypothetical protein